MTCLSKMYLYQKNIWFTKCLEVWNLVYIYLDFCSVHPFQQVSVISKISEYEIVNLTLHCFSRCEQTWHCISSSDWYRIDIIALHRVINLIARLLIGYTKIRSHTKFQLKISWFRGVIWPKTDKLGREAKHWLINVRIFRPSLISSLVSCGLPNQISAQNQLI